MINRRFTHFLLLANLLSLILVISSCDKFEGDQSIPAYISIDSLYLKTTSASQGSASASITDAWVYLDDNLIGAFELPARFPVLANGKHNLKILPGIKLNGISATRMAYPFYTSIEQSVELTENETDSLGFRNTTYFSSTIFDLVEGFEGVAIAFDTTNRSDVALLLTQPGDSLTFEGNHSGMVLMNGPDQFFECVNDKDFLIPFAPVFMEMNFRTNSVFVVGIYLYGVSTIQQVPIIYLNPTDSEWKKIYINLTNSLNAYTGMQKFRVFISAIQTSSETESLILLDNIKVITRNAE